MFGPPGGGKSHLAAAIGLALVENGWRVLFMRTTDLVQRLQVARQELALESAIAKLDKYHADHGQPAVRRMGKGVPRSSHDAGGHRPPRPPRYDPRNERRELPPQDRH